MPTPPDAASPPSQHGGPSGPKPPRTQECVRPERPFALFLAFNRLALRGFGGVLPWAQRTLVEEERWLTDHEFVEMLSLAQVLPGPNIGNLALMVGDRFFGLRGALAALAGMFAAPLVIVLTLAILYSGFSDQPMVAAALRGMGAVSAGLIAAIAIKLIPGRRHDRVAMLMVAATFVLVGVVRLPLLWVMFGLGSLSVWAYRVRQRP